MLKLVPALFGVALSLFACQAPNATSCGDCLRLAPPAPGLSARIFVLPAAGRPPDLRVSAALMNQTATTFVVLQCPLVIRFSPYPPGSYGAAGSDACPSDSPTRLLVPGDSSLMTRVLGADTLASLVPGQYRVAVNVTFHEVTRTDGNTTVGMSAGIIQLPLDSTSQPMGSTSP